MESHRTVIVLLSVLLATCVHAQTSSMDLDSMAASTISPRYLDQVAVKTGKISRRLDRQTAKAIRNWQKQEDKLRRMLSSTDSMKAKQLFDNSRQDLALLQGGLASPAKLQEYIPSFDSLTTSLKFLQQNPALLSKAKRVEGKIKTALNKSSNLDQRLAKAEFVKKYIRERRQMLNEQLAKVGGPYAKTLKGLNKQAYYYSTRLTEYKTLLKDKKKAERKGLQYLSKTKVFKDFLRKNSQLASLFRLPTDPNDPSAIANLGGLQTRAQVNNLIQQQLASAGPDAMAKVQQNIQQAQSQLNELKGKLLKSGSSGSGDVMPEGFRPNNQKTKSFLKRIELGMNIQSQKSNRFFPSTSDLGLSIGYRLNDRSVIGVGGSYKLGLGKDIRHMKVSHQGIGLRSFVEWTIKGSFWLAGGYEMNYRSEIRSIQQLKDRSGWQESGLIGVSKVVSFKTKFFQNTKLQLLWDMLSYRQRPQTPAVIFRVGYSFK